MIRYLFIAMVVTGMVSACSKTRPRKVEDQLINSSWRITTMIDDNQNISYFFLPYVMKFEKEGAVSVSDGEHLFTGNWSVVKENVDNEGGKETVLKFEFSAISSFCELNHSWKITDLTEERIDAEHINSKGGTDQITMIKK